MLSLTYWLCTIKRVLEARFMAAMSGHVSSHDWERVIAAIVAAHPNLVETVSNFFKSFASQPHAYLVAHTRTPSTGLQDI